MRTDDFIGLLAQDTASPGNFRAAFTMAAAGGVIIAAVLFFAALGFRPDISEAMRSGRFLFKFVVTIALAVTAAGIVRRLGAPTGSLARRGGVLTLAPALLLGAVVFELIATPAGQWEARLIGRNAGLCLTLIPLLAIGPLACFLAALRRGAPANPGLAGAIAGLAASGVAATFYAANCADDSPLFVAAWYPMAALVVAAAGFLIGRKLLRW